VANRGMSNRKGRWRIKVVWNRGRFRATVARKVFTAANGNTVVCLADKSRSIRIRRGR
jgi:hypothetical protein